MGTSPHSGHYVCHIKDETLGRWIIYNDNKVTIIFCGICNRDFMEQLRQDFSDSTPKVGSERFKKSTKSLISALQLISQISTPNYLSIILTLLNCKKSRKESHFCWIQKHERIFFLEFVTIFCPTVDYSITWLVRKHTSPCLKLIAFYPGCR